MEKTVVILADSLTNDFLNADPEFLQTKVNIGKNEIQRLVGDGKGPLISFLRGAVKARQAGKNVHLILIRDWHDADDPAQQPELLRHGFHNIKQTRGAEFVPWLQDIVFQARVINTPSLALPVRDFHRVMKKILSKDILSLNYNEQKTVIFVVAGLYTDIRVLNIASKMFMYAPT
jgi:nicotinamidase-related amidase